MDKEELRELFMAIAVVEHHAMIDSVLSPFDICDRLAIPWGGGSSEIGPGSGHYNQCRLRYVDQRVGCPSLRFRAWRIPRCKWMARVPPGMWRL